MAWLDGVADGSAGSSSGDGAAGGDIFIPLLGLLVSVCTWGTFAIPMKMEAVVKVRHPSCHLC